MPIKKGIGLDDIQALFPKSNGTPMDIRFNDVT